MKKEPINRLHLNCPFVNGRCEGHRCIHFKFIKYGADRECMGCGGGRIEQVFKTTEHGGIDYESVCMGCGSKDFKYDRFSVYGCGISGVEILQEEEK